MCRVAFFVECEVQRVWGRGGVRIWVFIEFRLIEDKICKIFGGIVLYVLHEFVNVSHGNVKIFKMFNGGVVDNTSNARNKCYKFGRGPTMLLLSGIEKRGIFGMFKLGGFHGEAVITICEFNEEDIGVWGWVQRRGGIGVGTKDA